MSIEIRHVRKFWVLPEAKDIIRISVTGDNLSQPLIPVDSAHLALSIDIEHFLAGVAVPDYHFLASSAFIMIIITPVEGLTHLLRTRAIVVSMDTTEQL